MPGLTAVVRLNINLINSVSAPFIRNFEPTSKSDGPQGRTSNLTERRTDGRTVGLFKIFSVSDVEDPINIASDFDINFG